MACLRPWPIVSYPSFSSEKAVTTPFRGHSVSRTAMKALSSNYSPTFSSVLPRTWFKTFVFRLQPENLLYMRPYSQFPNQAPFPVASPSLLLPNLDCYQQFWPNASKFQPTSQPNQTQSRLATILHGHSNWTFASRVNEWQLQFLPLV